MKDCRFEFDFTHWSELARNDPDAFEARRREVIREAIDHAAPDKRQRLHGLQWRIDRMRELAASPLSACVQMSQMMWESLMGEHGLLETLQQPLAAGSRPGPREPAKVIPLPRRH